MGYIACKFKIKLVPIEDYRFEYKGTGGIKDLWLRRPNETEDMVGEEEYVKVLLNLYIR